MAVIGGIFNGDMTACKSDLMLEMSRGMMTRGGVCRRAYVNKGAAVFSGTGACDGDKSPSLATVVRDGKNITVALDGEICPAALGLFGDFSSIASNCAEILVEGYLKYGQRLWERLSGEYAIAIYDESRGELMLARDGNGSRPLFFAKVGYILAFSSEIKGLLRFMPEPPEIDVSALEKHIFSGYSPCGASVYKDIYEVPAGEGLVISRLGLNTFRIAGGEDAERCEYVNSVVVEELLCPEKEEIEKLLSEILFAFDYPEFDALMPSFIAGLRQVESMKNNRFSALADGTLCMNTEYSALRRDRLCSYFGRYIMCVPPKKSNFSEVTLKRLEKKLKEILYERDMTFLYRLLGHDLDARIEREKNTAKRIRIEGMLYQTLLWRENYNLRISARDARNAGDAGDAGGRGGRDLLFF